MHSSKSGLSFVEITSSWSKLKSFSNYAVEAALEAIVKYGKLDVARYFARTMQLLPFTRTSLETVMVYALGKAAEEYNANKTRVEIEASKVPGFEKEVNKVKEAFEDMLKLGVVSEVLPGKEKAVIDITKNKTLADLVRVLAAFLAKTPGKFDFEAFSTKYDIVSGVSSLYVLNEGGEEGKRLPRGLRVAIGLVSPAVGVNKDGSVDKKGAMSEDDWVKARENMSTLRELRERFYLYYFHAIGILYDNKIIISSTYPIQVDNDFVNHVLVPAYERYYERYYGLGRAVRRAESRGR